MNTQKFFKIILCAVIICILIISGFGIAGYLKDVEGKPSLDSKSDNGDINVLVMATDKGGLLTDTIMLASISDKHNMVNILSIPRDTRVKINGRSYKINSAYGMGKENERIDLPLELITDITGLEINYYAVVNPKVVRDIVDLVGGVEIDIPQRMYYKDPYQDLYIDLYPGVQVLDGNKAEQFLRFRSGYANADLGRIDAQQMFVKEFISQKFKFKYITKAKAIFNAVEENVDTNISAGDILKFSKLAINFNDYQINTFQLPGSGGSYFFHDDEQTKKLIQDVFLNHIIQSEE